MSTGSNFSVISTEVVCRFLQSAVIVDDHPYFTDPPPQELVAPGRRPPQTKVESGTSKAGVEAGRHDLDARRLINAFADFGVVCAVLQPILQSPIGDTIESLSMRTDRATQRADIVILDWNMPPEDQPGQNAKRLIQEILRTDKPSGVVPRGEDHSRRLRLIAIYTGDGLASIKKEAENLLTESGLGSVTSGTYHVTAGPVMITVYGKDGSSIVGDDANRRVGEGDLPKLLQGDFTRMTEGLLSNAALAALSAIRTNTHRILSRFNPVMDAPYVAHRAMMEPPEEAEEHPVPLIASEIEGVIADDDEIAKLVGLDAIKEWLDSTSLQEEALRDTLGMDSGAFKEVFLSLLQKGLNKADGGSEFPRWGNLVESLKNNDRSAASVLTRILAPGETDETSPDMKFALLTSLRWRYEEPPRVLKLGTIVATDEGGNTRYWLCVQPVCDSVRLSSARSFPFLKLKIKGPSDGEPFDFVVLDSLRGEYKRLRCSRKPFDMILFKMEPERSSKSVKARRDGDSWLFDRAGGESPLRWIADLKTDHAHRIVDLFANEIKRVGLTESEWLRRMAIQR